ncbi:hypothetical protein, partial [Lactiplantibacillus plantarum]|uniref:hypothetical protein n=1 Tax=Lactiplantibacillus plantarum TaxID=1590 RepID=UPI0037543A5E
SNLTKIKSNVKVSKHVLRRLIPSNLITPWHFHIPLFYLCELAQKRCGIGCRLALIGENEFVKFTGITPRPFP